MIEFLEAAIRIATPLMFAALGGILSERAGVFAVGLEGMMLMGAFGGAIGAWASGSAVVGVALAILCGAAHRARRGDCHGRLSSGQHGHGSHCEHSGCRADQLPHARRCPAAVVPSPFT